MALALPLGIRGQAFADIHTHPHANAKRPAVRPVVVAHASLGLDGRGYGIRGGGKHGEERVPSVLISTPPPVLIASRMICKWSVCTGV